MVNVYSVVQRHTRSFGQAHVEPVYGILATRRQPCRLSFSFDYLLEYSIDSQREGKEFLSIAESNHHLYHLMQKMKNNFVPQEWNEMKSDTKFFKLSYKGHDVQAAMDNPRSYYNIVISSK